MYTNALQQKESTFNDSEFGLILNIVLSHDDQMTFQARLQDGSTLEKLSH